MKDVISRNFNKSLNVFHNFLYLIKTMCCFMYRHFVWFFYLLFKDYSVDISHCVQIFVSFVYINSKSVLFSLILLIFLLLLLLVLSFNITFCYFLLSITLFQDHNPCQPIFNIQPPTQFSLVNSIKTTIQLFTLINLSSWYNHTKFIKNLYVWPMLE